MEEIERRLYARRAEITETLADGSMRLRFTTLDKGRAAELSLQQELATIEQTLTQLEATQAQRDETARRREDDHARDDATFWLRRFMLSLQIGNGAGFLAVMAAVAQHADKPWMLRLADTPALCFGFGIVLAGGLPFLLWLERRWRMTPVDDSATPWLAGLAAALFVGGVGSLALTVNKMARHPTSPPAASSALQTPEPPPTAASASTPAPAAPPSPPNTPDQRPASGAPG